jgi:hypothetical protein
MTKVRDSTLNIVVFPPSIRNFFRLWVPRPGWGIQLQADCYNCIMKKKNTQITNKKSMALVTHKLMQTIT